MLQNSKSSFRCDLTKTTDGANLECSSNKRRFKKGKKLYSQFLSQTQPNQSAIVSLYPWEGMIWKSTQEDHYAQVAILPRRTSTKSWNMANKHCNRRAPNSAAVEHKTTTGAPIHVQSILCMKSLLSAREHIIRSGDALYLQYALSKHIGWKYPPIRRWNYVLWFSMKSWKVDAPPLLRWKHIFPRGSFLVFTL